MTKTCKISLVESPFHFFSYFPFNKGNTFEKHIPLNQHIYFRYLYYHLSFWQTISVPIWTQLRTCPIIQKITSLTNLRYHKRKMRHTSLVSTSLTTISRLFMLSTGKIYFESLSDFSFRTRNPMLNSSLVHQLTYCRITSLYNQPIPLSSFHPATFLLTLPSPQSVTLTNFPTLTSTTFPTY